MIRALWFLIKLSVLLAAMIWLVQRPGTIDIEWLGYQISTSVGFAVAVFLGFLFLWTQSYRIYRMFVDVPTVLRRYRVATRREKGYRAVTAGLVAVAAGDGRAAEKFTRRANDMIPGTPLTKLLSAQSAMMNGEAPRARREFRALLEDDDAAFFGLRGLLVESLRDKNYGEALQLMARAEKLQPHRVWILRTLFDLETRSRVWKKALITLKKSERMGLFDAKTARLHRQAILTADAGDLLLQGTPKDAYKTAQKAFDIDPAFTPAALLYAKTAGAKDKRRAALKAIEAGWTANPHPDLAKLWMDLMPPPKKNASLQDAGRHAYDWMKNLADLAPQHRDSHRALGLAALDARLWKEARVHLAQGSDYRALARLELAENNDRQAAAKFIEKAEDMQPDPAWVCQSCGHAEKSWHALCPQCETFNQIVWMTPGATQAQLAPPPAHLIDSGFIAPPGSF